LPGTNRHAASGGVSDWLSICAGVALLAGGLAGCASAPSDSTPSERLDERTGATITSVDKPLVFARDRSERAANLRDYVTVATASVNRGGKRELVLVAYIWSTLDPTHEPAVADADALVLVADDRRIRLSANGKTPHELGIDNALDVPAGQSVKPLVFPTDLATLRYVAAARSLQIQTRVADAAVTYELWEDQRPALDRFVRFLEGER
jgi:hypothetical protein